MEYRQIESVVAEVHQQLGMDLTQAVDVFDVIKRLGIFLHFRRLDNLLGAYLNPNGNTPGILINAKHPLHLQRFTAAHELGHYCLKHEPTTDATNAVGVWHSDPEFARLGQNEQDANTFSALFLMPYSLMSYCAASLGITLQKDAIKHDEALMLSLLLGTSRLATVNRLNGLGLVSDEYRQILLGRRPKEIKEAVGGYKPDGLVERKITWNDVVVLDQRSSSASVLLEQDQILQLCLDTRETAGYVWEPANVPPGLHVEWSTKSLADDDVVGTGVRHVFTVVGLRPGAYLLRFIERRPWQPQRVRAEYLVRIQIERARIGMDIDQLVSCC